MKILWCNGHGWNHKRVYRIGGGIENSLSLLELFALLESELQISMGYVQLPPRESDQRVFVADIAKAERMLGWKPVVYAQEGVARMVEWVGAT